MRQTVTTLAALALVLALLVPATSVSAGQTDKERSFGKGHSV